MKTIINNKKARFNYEIISEYQAGIKLVGSEVKQIKNGKASISEGYCIFKDDELFITGMNISNSDINVGVFAHDPIRERKLLLHRRELNKLKESVTIKGLTIVPLKVILTDTGFIKLKIAICRGMKTHDKRNSLKEKDLKREIERNS